MSKPRILVCGEALFDVFVGDAHQTGFAMDARIGGSAFNVAVGAARLDCDSALLTGIANDVLGERLVTTLEAEGVSTAHIARKDARTTLALVALDDAGVAQYAFYGEGGADRMVTDLDLPTSDDADACVFGCFSILTQPTGDAFLNLAARTNALVVLDPNVRLTVEGNLRVWRDRVAAFARHADIIKVSEDDLFALYGDDADLDALAAGWLADGVKLVAITHGGDGATFHSGHG
ncbi:MAG: PfkB family carbohydrate kinase, partial [Pseudomonadota bacterium]